MTNLIVPNDTARAMAWASTRWPQTRPDNDWGLHVTLHTENEAGITAVVVYNQYQPANSIDIHVAAVDGARWLTRPFLSAVFRYPFEQLGVRRVTARIGADNAKAKRFLESLGFTLEGVVRQGWEPDTDLLMFGLLKSECRFLGKTYGQERRTGRAGPDPGRERANTVEYRDGDE